MAKQGHCLRGVGFFGVVLAGLLWQACASKEAAWQQCEGRECRHIGVEYDKKQEYAQAKVCYEKACEAQDMDACYNLGILYMQGRGVDRELAQALMLYGRACKGGLMHACYNEATLQARENPYHAFNLFKKACEQGGLKEACQNLAILYAQGRGTKRNLPKAKQMLQTLCNEGYATACKNYGILADEN